LPVQGVCVVLYIAVALGLMVCLLFGLRRLIISRTYQLFGKLVHRVDTDKKVIALTFDDGPKPGYTEKILEVLDAEQVKATFFLLGQDMEGYPEETKLIVAARHEVGNHAYSHKRMVFVSRARVAKEFEETEALIQAAGFDKETVFRPPFGSKLFALPRYLKKHNKITVTWDIEPETDDESAGNAEKIADYVIKHARPGSIVLLHVMFDSRKPSMQAVPKIIRQLKSEGYQFVTASELIGLQKRGGH